MKRLGGNPGSCNRKIVFVSKGESIADTAKSFLS